jgi:hypothetical protein
MVLGYWDMAASLVTMGAIDADAFRAAHGEMFGTFAKIEPFLAEMRAGVRRAPRSAVTSKRSSWGRPTPRRILARRRQGCGWRPPRAARRTRRRIRVEPRRS